MIPPLDIFRMESNGSLIWCRVCNDLDAVKELIRTLAESHPGYYVVFSQKTGHMFFVGPDAAAGKSSG
jgi:hypothetical protein